MREFLGWVVFRPRSHADVMDAWQSHCPRFTLWEDALDEQLVELELGCDGVTLTARGRRASTPARRPLATRARAANARPPVPALE
jgi:hypothetical protein